jgi:hypothetical protein
MNWCSRKCCWMIFLKVFKPEAVFLYLAECGLKSIDSAKNKFAKIIKITERDLGNR